MLRCAIVGSPPGIGFVRASSTTLRAYLLLSPALLTVVLTLVVCLLVMVALSFWRQDYLQLVAAWTADNYTELVNKPVFVRLILRSIVVSGCVRARLGRACLSDGILHRLRTSSGANSRGC